MSNFDKWDEAFRSQDLNAFNNNENGIIWLKVRAICRGKQLSQFIDDNNLSLKSSKVSMMNRELFDLLEHRDDAMEMLDRYLRNINHEWYELVGVNYSQLKEDLYKIQNYAWGGDQNNSLDKYLVSRFVKVITDFSELERRKSEIAENAWNYVQNSWYNNWTSFMIESLFKRNRRVVSAVGEIKSVDFFIDDFPIDLKVTFFPSQFMDGKLKQILGKSKLAWLKAKAKEVNIHADTNTSSHQQMYTLTEKLYEQGYTNITDELKRAEHQVIHEAQGHPEELMKWLYENQGEMRFGAENRIYLILIDTNSLEQSWKLKRAFSIIEPIVDEYLDSFSSNSLKRIDFKFKMRTFSSMADIIFIIR